VAISRWRADAGARVTAQRQRGDDAVGRQRGGGAPRDFAAAAGLVRRHRLRHQRLLQPRRRLLHRQVPPVCVCRVRPNAVGAILGAAGAADAAQHRARQVAADTAGGSGCGSAVCCEQNGAQQEMVAACCTGRCRRSSSPIRGHQHAVAKVHWCHSRAVGLLDTMTGWICTWDLEQ